MGSPHCSQRETSFLAKGIENFCKATIRSAGRRQDPAKMTQLFVHVISRADRASDFFSHEITIRARNRLRWLRNVSIGMSSCRATDSWVGKPTPPVRNGFSAIKSSALRPLLKSARILSGALVTSAVAQMLAFDPTRPTCNS
jgi:hypothetical protein